MIRAGELHIYGRIPEPHHILTKRILKAVEPDKTVFDLLRDFAVEKCLQSVDINIDDVKDHLG